MAPAYSVALLCAVIRATYIALHKSIRCWVLTDIHIRCYGPRAPRSDEFGGVVFASLCRVRKFCLSVKTSTIYEPESVLWSPQRHYLLFKERITQNCFFFICREALVYRFENCLLLLSCCETYFSLFLSRPFSSQLCLVLTFVSFLFQQGTKGDRVSTKSESLTLWPSRMTSIEFLPTVSAMNHTLRS